MEKMFKGISRFLEHALILIFSVLVLDVLWQVIARYAGINSGFTEELSRFLLIWLAVLATAYSRSYKGQMAIDFIYAKLSKSNQYKLSLFIEMSILLFALFVMVIGGGNLVYITLKLHQLSPSLGWPVGVVYSVVPLSGSIIILFSIYHITEFKKMYKEVLSHSNLNQSH